MKTKYLLLTLLLTLVAVLTMKAERHNVLSIPDVTTLTGNAQLPIELKNSDEVVALQFDLTLPVGITAGTIAIPTNRIDGHDISVRCLGGQRYRILILSAQNHALRGQQGTVMYLPVTIPDNFAEGSEHPLAIANATVIAATGENVMTEATAGSLFISSMPDLAVSSITTDSRSLSPGDHLVVSWRVENIGLLATQTGWSEQLSLVSDDGTTAKLLATTRHEEPLEAGGVVSRQAEITLPTLPGVDGETRILIRIVPDAGCGESPSAQGNNTQTSANTIYINKVLTLEVTPQRTIENANGRVALRLNRSGSWLRRESFTVTATADSRLQVPEMLTIQEGQSGVLAYLAVADNKQLDADSVVSITVEGNGYAAVAQRVVIEDDELPTLSLSASPSVVSEGDTLQLTISTDRVKTIPLTVALRSENDTRFALPTQAVIPAGATSVTVEVVAVDDELPSLELSNIFTASAPGYNHGQAIVLLKDDDLPVLELTLTPGIVTEGAGVVAVAGTLRRTTNINSKITVKLTDDSNGTLFFPTKTLTMAKGVKEISFNFGPIDNSEADGDRTYTLTAAVWMASCSCNASGESAGAVKAQLRLLDDDGPALRLSTTASMLNEGGQATLTVSHNTATDKPLTLRITSDSDDRLQYDPVVTIPAGQSQQNVTVTAPANSEEGDTRNIVFTAEADGYASSTCWFTLTDKTMADAQVLNVSAESTEAVAGDTIMVAVLVGNTGTASLAKQTKVTFHVDGATTPSVTAYLQEPLQAATTVTLQRGIVLPATVGHHTVQVAVNADRQSQELNYTNNVSSPLGITVAPPFSATVSVDKAVYEKGEAVSVSGIVNGRNVGNREVEVYVVNRGYRHAIATTTDGDGRFQAGYLPYDNQLGHFSVGACYKSEGLTQEMASFEIRSLERTSRQAVTADFHIDETATGTIGLMNPSQLPLTGVTVKAVDVPADGHVTVSCPPTIAGGATANISYTVRADALTEGNGWQVARIEVTTAEGLSLSIPLYYYCRNNRGQLQPSISAINTTLNIYSSREYPFTITNIGKGETGVITLALPSWMQTVTPSNMPSLKQGESAQVVLRLTSSDRMQLNVPVTGQIGVNCENGNGFALPYSVEPVSQTTGTLIIDACDENTYNTVEKPHLQGATVVVSHPATGAVLAQGVTSSDGIFRQELPEGCYNVKVTAEKHDSYQNNIIISPAQDNDITVNLSLQAITVAWNVVETEVEDEYRIETTVEFETNVPVPVVVLSAPSSVEGDNLKPGESLFIPVTLTNKGLIRAENVQLFLPEASDEWEIKALSDAGPMSLEPDESVNIALLLTKKQEASTQASRPRKLPHQLMNACMASFAWYYEWYCGEDIKSNMALYRMALKICASAEIYTTLSSTIGGGIGGSNSGSGGTGSTIWNATGGESGPGSPNREGTSCYEFSAFYGETGIASDSYFCDPCKMAVVEAVANTIGGTLYPVLGVCNSIADMAINTNTNGKVDPVDVATVGLNAASLASRVAGVASIAVSILDVLRACIDNDDSEDGDKEEDDDDDDDDDDENKDKDKENDEENKDIDKEVDLPKTPWDPWNAWNELRIYNNVARKYYEQLKTTDKALRQIVVSRIWYENGSEDFTHFFNAMKEQGAEGELKADSLLPYKPEAVSKEWVEFLVERINNSYEGSTAANRINIDSLMADCKIIQDYDREAQENGYTTMSEWYDAALGELKDELSESSSSVCSSVTIQFSQTLVMTRQAFRGTLTVHNGHDTEAMKDIRLNLTITNDEGVAATEREFRTNMESLYGFGGETTFDSGWTLDAQADGTLTVLFIPSKYAAPEADRKYAFGGTLTYTDPFTGLEVTRRLNPVTLTVKPSPQIDLTYFMQRDILGDDPLTEETEPMELAEFALFITNHGNSDATNVRITTAQPVITRNEKGLKDSLVIVSSQLNGEDKLLLMSESQSNDFGTITARSSAYAQWWLQNSLLGHFTAYNVAATHLTSYGNQDLSLLDNVSIHELIHGFTPYAEYGEQESKRAFLVNDVVDTEDLPDQVYFTNGTQQTVRTTATSILAQQREKIYELTVKASGNGWTYGSILAPAVGESSLMEVIRERDGAKMPADNFWFTSRTLRDGKDPLYENRLHFIVQKLDDSETYILTYEPDDVTLKLNPLTIDEGDRRLQLSLQENGNRLLISGEHGKILHVEVSDLRGIKRISMSENVSGSLYIGMLPKGIYTVHIATEKGTRRTKILKK